MPRFPCKHHCNPCGKLTTRMSKDGYCFKHQWLCHNSRHKTSWVVGNNQRCEGCLSERPNKEVSERKYPGQSSGSETEETDETSEDSEKEELVGKKKGGRKK